MKKLNTIGKLNLVKENISKLDNTALLSIKGGMRKEKRNHFAFRHVPSSPLICKVAVANEIA